MQRRRPNEVIKIKKHEQDWIENDVSCYFSWDGHKIKKLNMNVVNVKNIKL